MRWFLVVFLLTVVTTTIAFAQNDKILIPPPIIRIEDASRNVGKLVTVDGILAHITKRSSDLKILTIIGNGAPYWSMQIIIKGPGVKLNLRKLKSAHMVFHGKIVVFNNNPVIVVNHPSQIGFSSD